MAEKGVTPAKIIAACVVIMGLIHFGVGVGIVSKYKKYGDVFRQPVGLSGFNIVIGILAIVTGIFTLITIIRDRPALSKVGAIMAGILSIFTIASFITALALNSQAVTYTRNRLSFHMNTYVEIDGSIDVMDTVQSNFKCCGENLWLDWARAGLGSTGIGTNTGTGTGTNTGTGTGTNTGSGTVVSTGTGTVTGRRRRDAQPSLFSPLVKAIRERRQTVGGSNNIYNLPTTYTINLPLSCCKSGGVTTGNAVGGYCVFNAGNGTVGFYVQGCIVPTANVIVSQITGIAVINIVLAILSILIIVMFRVMFPAAYENKDPNKPSLSNQVNQEGQQNMTYNSYYIPQAAGYYQPQQQQYQTPYVPAYTAQAPPVYVAY